MVGPVPGSVILSISSLVAHSQQVQADELAAAFASERLRRGLPELGELAVPDEEMWRNGYQAVARDVSGVAEKTLAADHNGLTPTGFCVQGVLDAVRDPHTGTAERMERGRCGSRTFCMIPRMSISVAGAG